MFSCSSVKDKSSGTALELEKLAKSDLNAMIVTGKMDAAFESKSYNFAFKMVIGQSDSLEMEVFGPFGVSVGKLFADEKNFTFLNSFENRIYKGKSSMENFKRAFRIMISIKELIALVRNSLPYSQMEYVISESSEAGNLYKYIAPTGEFADFLFVNNSGITKFQRKETGNILSMNADMSNFELIDNYSLAKTINWSFPSAKADLNIKIDKFTINPEGVKPKMFTYSSNMTVIDLDTIE
jgi:hypothetical protein